MLSVRKEEMRQHNGSGNRGDLSLNDLLADQQERYPSSGRWRPESGARLIQSFLRETCSASVVLKENCWRWEGLGRRPQQNSPVATLVQMNEGPFFLDLCSPCCPRRQPLRMDFFSFAVLMFKEKSSAVFQFIIFPR